MTDGGSDGFLGAHLRRLARAAGATAALEPQVERYAEWVLETLRRGGKLLWAGNGGSAAAAEHVAADYLVRYRRRRRHLPAIALSSSSAAVTAAANDFAYEEVFARSLRALATPKDLLVLHSTSGESLNVVRAAEAAREIGLRSVALLAGDGGTVGRMVDLAIVVPTDETATAQELHLAVEHAVAGRVESEISAAPEGSG